ncbi:carbamoyltransferase family protein [Longimicrobium sp.]|uniref:carbamoyltransferase family protein n=1 Tax=Longimicrobium sp. TaxID=2029185 RepID=UPI002D06407F|nr:carbamoyltransferase C-terminal domain-containing protein [Longimicrobium sp.]HSU17093.1 carbamoyltransferase C-terminal domain-containing protein [Longimicrobium sp.]
MVILGISPPAHESAAGLVVDGTVVAAAAEERFTRVKNQGGMPRQAIQAVLDLAGIGPRDVDAVALPWLAPRRELMLNARNWARNLPFAATSGAPLRERGAHLANYTRNIVRDPNWASGRRLEREITQPLVEMGLAGRIHYVDHQAAHVASAYFSSGFDRALGVSLDGYGSGAAGSFYLCEGGRMRLLQSIPYPHSLGTFYRRVTQALGFKPNRHEGKIVGLAAFGDPEVLGPRVREGFDVSRDDYYRLKTPQDPYGARRLAGQYSREDMAAAYQTVLEEVVQRYVALYLARHGLTHVVGAGGVFANVKMNQRVMEIPGVEKIFVYPAMSDGGVGTGAALWLAARSDGLMPRALDHVYLGPGFTEREIEAAVRESGLPFERAADPDAEVARLVAEGKVVARFDGRMEYGPRALGNRSILYSATDPTVNDWLNRRLNRTEFMPFAPMALAHRAGDLFHGVERARHAAEFMTVTFDCTDRMKAIAPAAVHVDGTARPQLVTERSNPGVFRMLAEYERLTGSPTVINTSFNMHEEPIVCTPRDAVRAFMDGRLDVLAAGPFVVHLNGRPGERAGGERMRTAAVAAGAGA